MFDLVDQEILEVMRIDRLRGQIYSLEYVGLHIDLNQNLLIHCQHAHQVEALLRIKRQLKEQVWLILGCSVLSIWFKHELIHAEATRDS
jgi:hypothetical protein